jgi:hypothetical protein
MGIPNRTLPLIRALMADGVPRSAPEIAQLIGSQKKYVRQILTDLVEDGAAHIESYRGPYKTSFYLLCAGENATKPESQSPRHVLERARVRNRRVRAGGSMKNLDDKALDDLYRASAPWWPNGDPVVIGAVNAMVRCGRVSA